MFKTRPIIVVLCWLVLTSHSYAEIVNTATVERLLQREHIHNVVIDDKRKVVYFERLDARGESVARLPYTEPFSMARALSKIYVAPMSGDGGARPLFDQQANTGYYFAGNDPWSPDGRYLAIFKLREGRVQTGVYDLRRSRARFFGVEVRHDPGRSFLVWLSDQEYAFIRDENMKTRWFDLVNGPRALAAGREKGWRGGEVTAEIVGSGRHRQPRVAPSTFNIERMNVRTGKTEPLVEGSEPALFAPEKPVGKVVMSENVLVPLDETANDRQKIKRVLSILDLLTGEKNSIAAPETGSLRFVSWSASGTYALARQRIGTEDESKSTSVYFVVNANSAKIVETLPTGASGFAWIDDTLTYYLSQDKEQVKSTVGRRGGIAMEAGISDPVAASDSSLYYLKKGHLWSADLNGIRKNLTREYLLAISVYDRPWRYWLEPTRSSDADRTLSLDEVDFVAALEGKQHLIKFSADGLSFWKAAFPHEEAQILAASTEGAVFLTNSQKDGSQLHYVGAGEKAAPNQLYHFNKHLAGIKTAVGPIRINHKGFDGRDITSWLYLPPGVSPDVPRPYPLVAIPYPGRVHETSDPDKRTENASIWDLHLSTNTKVEVFAAEGYAVLLPDIPLGPSGEPGEPMTQMMPAILSGLDAAIETGFVDPGRLVVSGHSFGGYTVLSMLAQTDRFSAGVAMSPVSNVISAYGEFSVASKVNANKQELPGGPYPDWSESSQGRMGSPPWKDPSRHVRNSPLFYADKMNTPVMLIHGGVDGLVDAGQSEEMFTALYREGKDALYVRYLGEQHVIEQPQNQRDMWARIFDFLEDSGVTPGPKTVH